MVGPARPYITRTIGVGDCSSCPFDTYTGGICECMHPAASHLRGVDTNSSRRRKGCPLPTQAVLIVSSEQKVRKQTIKQIKEYLRKVFTVPSDTPKGGG